MFRRLSIRGLALLTSALLSGCAVSLHPLYEDKDDLLDPTPYKGVWQNERWMLRVETRDGDEKKSTFIVTLLEVPVGPHADATMPIPPDTMAALVGGLVKIGDQEFLDLAAPPGLLQFPGPELAPSAVLVLMMPAHAFFKIKRKKDRLVLVPLDRDKLDKLLDREPRAVAHTRIKSQELAELGGNPLSSLLLTAEPKQLREFLQKYGKADIWPDEKPLEFRRGKSEEFEKRLQRVAKRLSAVEKARDKASHRSRGQRIDEK